MYREPKQSYIHKNEVTKNYIDNLQTNEKPEKLLVLKTET